MSAATTPAHGTDAAAALTGGRLLARNALGNVVSQCLPMAVALVTMPWLIRGLGTDRFGVLTLAWMVLGYFSLFDLGLGRALTQTVAEKLGRGASGEVPGLVWTAFALMAGLGAAGAVLVAAGTPWLIGQALKVPGPLRIESVGAFYLMAAALPAVILTAGFRGVMEAYQRFGAVIAVRTVTSLAVLLGPLAVLPFTDDLVAVVGVVALLRVASCLAHAGYCLRSIPGLRGGAAVRPALVRPLLGYGGWMTAVNVVNPLMVQMDRFLIAALVSTAAVAYYTTPFELITRSWFLSGSVVAVVFPAFATSYVGDRGRTAAIFGRCLKSVGLILFPIALGGVAVGREVLSVWVGADFAAEGARVLQWLSVGVLFNGLAQVPSALIQGVGRPGLTFKVHAAEVVPYLAAAWVLTGRYGIEGAAAAWAGRTAVDLVLMGLAARAVLPEGAAAVRGAWAGAAAGAAVLAAAAVLPHDLVHRAAVLAAGAATFAAVGWWRVLTANERGALAGRLAALRRAGPAAGDVGGPVAAGGPGGDGSEPALTGV